MLQMAKMKPKSSQTKQNEKNTCMVSLFLSEGRSYAFCNSSDGFLQQLAKIHKIHFFLSTQLGMNLAASPGLAPDENIKFFTFSSFLICKGEMF